MAERGNTQGVPPTPSPTWQAQCREFFCSPHIRASILLLSFLCLIVIPVVVINSSKQLLSVSIYSPDQLIDDDMYTIRSVTAIFNESDLAREDEEFKQLVMNITSSIQRNDSNSTYMNRKPRKFFKDKKQGRLCDAATKITSYRWPSRIVAVDSMYYCVYPVSL